MMVISLLQTVPGLALLVMMMALFGTIGAVPALASLVLYALLPIARNSLTGMTAVSPGLAEAARGIGMSRWQELWRVRLPLSIPSTIAGLRTAAVQAVGLATLAAFVGAGGLGQFINRGLFLADMRLVLLGAIPAALLALLMDGTIALVEYAIQPGRRWSRKTWIAAFGAGFLLCLMGGASLYAIVKPAQSAGVPRVTIGSKNFTEQLIVAEIIAQWIEAQSEIPVKRAFQLGGTKIVHQALLDGQIDLAVEYTGTAWMSILGNDFTSAPLSADGLAADVRRNYHEKFALNWLVPLGFNNSYCLAVARANPSVRGVQTISGLARRAKGLRAGFDFEFAGRSDGYRGLKARYGLNFQSVRDMHQDLMFEMLLDGHVDVISAYSTDGRLDEQRFRLLVDDLNFFPPYEAGIVVREEILRQFPSLGPALRQLAGALDDQTMRRLNAQADLHHRIPREIAREWITEFLANKAAVTPAS
jgi:osmoprotectant transport system permease protein